VTGIIVTLRPHEHQLSARTRRKSAPCVLAPGLHAHPAVTAADALHVNPAVGPLILPSSAWDPSGGALSGGGGGLVHHHPPQPHPWLPYHITGPAAQEAVQQQAAAHAGAGGGGGPRTFLRLHGQLLSPAV
jgi:hypothetical protein